VAGPFHDFKFGMVPSTLTADGLQRIKKNPGNLSYCVHFFWAIPRRLNFMCRRFGTRCSIFIGRVNKTNENGTEFRNVGTYNSDVGIRPKVRIQHSKQRDLEIKKLLKAKKGE
jgi:hypothetical protein